MAIPLLPSVLLTVLSAVALMRKQKFRYYNSSFAAVFNIIMLIVFLLTYSVAMRGQRREDLWVLTALVPLGLILSGAYLLGYVGYRLTNTSDENALALPQSPLWMAIVAICGYRFLLVYSLMQSA